MEVQVENGGWAEFNLRNLWCGGIAITSASVKVQQGFDLNPSSLEAIAQWVERSIGEEVFKKFPTPESRQSRLMSIRGLTFPSSVSGVNGTPVAVGLNLLK